MKVTLALLAAFAASPLVAQTDPHAEHAKEAAKTATAAPAAPRNEALPADADQAKDAIAKSPRHGEFVDVALPGGGKLLTWAVYPERKEKAPVVIVIHEIFGLSDWVRAVADQLAKEGFIALAPDLLSGMGPNGGGTESLGADATKVIRNLTREDAAARLDAVRAYALRIPAANGKVGTVGFCWGGSTSFGYAALQPKLDAAVVYYGSSPEDPAAYEKISAPVVGFYAGDDARVNATIPRAEEAMKKLGKRYTVNVYEGAGHGFLRQQSGRDGANARATAKAWPATVAFLRETLR